MSSKKSKTNLFLIGGAVLGLIYGFRKFNSIEQIKIFLTGFKFRADNFINSTLMLNFRVVNPGLLPAKFESISGEIFVNNIKLADIFYLQTFNIGPRSENNLNLPVTINNLRASSEILNFLSSNERPQIKVVGKINSRGASIPFETIL